MKIYFCKVAIFYFSVISGISQARDPLHIEQPEGFGQPSEGLGQLLKELPEDDPVSIKFRSMVRQITANGGHVREVDMGSSAFANHVLVAPGITVFRYNPERLRAIDALEEILHWQQLQPGGDYWRDYSSHPLYQLHRSKGLIMELLAKQSLLQHPKLTPTLRAELKHELFLVKNNRYGLSVSDPEGSSADCEKLHALAL